MNGIYGRKITSNTRSACYLHFYLGDVIKTRYISRCQGKSVRPVRAQ